MSTLVVQIPPRARVQAGAPHDTPSGAGPGAEYDYVLTPDGLHMAAQGRCAVSLLPSATSTVAVLADADVSWHRITLPKAPASRLPAALIGVLEEALLDDATDVHLAVAPGAVAGQPTWVTAVDRAWLMGELAALEKGGQFIDRVVPTSWPDERPCGHFAERNGDPAQGATLTWSHAEGVAQIALQGTLARALLPDPLPEGTRFTASPGTAAAAERWLNTSVTVMDGAQRALQASRSLWNLRQFTLARKNRGARAVRDLWRQFLTPTWRPLRYGLLTLLAVQLIGLNLWAAHQSRAIDGKRKEMETLLRATHTQVRAVLDAPTQMQRETDLIRAGAGKPGDNDLEPMLTAAAAAWPADRPPVDNLRFEPGKLSLSAAGWDPSQIEQFRAQLRPGGWQLEALDGRVTISRIALPGGRL